MASLHSDLTCTLTTVICQISLTIYVLGFSLCWHLSMPWVARGYYSCTPKDLTQGLGSTEVWGNEQWSPKKKGYEADWTIIILPWASVACFGSLVSLSGQTKGFFCFSIKNDLHKEPTTETCFFAYVMSWKQSGNQWRKIQGNVY